MPSLRENPQFTFQEYEPQGIADTAEYIRLNSVSTPLMREYERLKPGVFDVTRRLRTNISSELEAITANRDSLGKTIWMVPNQPKFPNEYYTHMADMAKLALSGKTFGLCGQYAIYNAVVDIDPTNERMAYFYPPSQQERFTNHPLGGSIVERYKNKLQERGICSVELDAIPEPEDITRRVQTLSPQQRLLVSMVMSFPGYGKYTHWFSLMGLADIDDMSSLPELLATYPISTLRENLPVAGTYSNEIAFLAGDVGQLGIFETPFIALPWDRLSKQVAEVLRQTPQAETEELDVKLRGGANRGAETFSKNIAIVTAPARTG